MNDRTRSKAKPGKKAPLIIPEVHIPVLKIPQPDGSILIKPGKPEIVPEMIECLEAATLLGLSVRTMNYHCEMGLFKTAFKPSGRPRGRWKIARNEVMARRNYIPNR